MSEPTAAAAQDDSTLIKRTVRMPVSLEVLQQMLRLPADAIIHDVELRQSSSGFGHTVHFHVHISAPPWADIMNPVFHRAGGWPDPVQLVDIEWSADPRRQAVPIPPETPRADPPPARDVPTVGMQRCPQKMLFSYRDDAQCALYAGHLDKHETEPLAPVDADKASGVRIVHWRVDEDGAPTDVLDERIDLPDDEETPGD